MKNKIIVVVGDPRSINSEIIFKSWKTLNKKIKKQIYFVANYDLIKTQFQKLKFNQKIKSVNKFDLKENDGDFKIINVPLNFKNPFDISKKEVSKYIKNSFNLAHILAKQKNVKGLINCPIDKNYISKSRVIGITELLANKCQINDQSEVMMIYNKKLSVVPITTHINISNISNKISTKLIVRKISSLNKNYNFLFKKKPKIAVLGLNPHNGEMKKNSEEKLKIIPALKRLKKMKIRAYGPFVSDTFFIDYFKNFDVVVGMYHDQVLIPFKSLFHYNAINITLGLSYIRVSPDHGPAKDIIGKRKANPLSLLECIKFINNLN